MSFKAYPEIKSETFYDDIFAKKEFFKTRFESNFLNRNPHEVCSQGEFKLEKQQEFVRNFISYETPYNGILLFHGTGVGKTCAAISITEGLRDYVYKIQKKIYIISSEHPRDNFYNELYSARRAKLENEKHSAPGSYQCAGNRYHISENEIPDDELRMKKIKANIHKYYEFKGQNEFKNMIDIELGKKFGLSKEEIAKRMSGCVFVIDEAHGITGKGKSDSKGYEDKSSDIDLSDEFMDDYDEDIEDSNIDYNEDDLIYKNKLKNPAQISQRTFLNVLLELMTECRKINGNLKIILLTATPMKDKPNEIADLLDVLNTNDGVKIDRKKLFSAEGEVNEEYLYKISKGYVSFVRGNNPISFPLGINPPIDKLYNPEPIFSYYGENTNIITDEYVSYLDKEAKHKFEYNLYKCCMSIYQFKIFLQTKNIRDMANKNEKQCSGFVYPNNDIISILYDTYYPNTNVIKNYSGVLGFKRCFKENIISNEIDANGKIKKDKQYEIKKEIVDKFGYFIMIKNPLHNVYNLKLFSTKFYEIINNINSINGISYCYCEYDLASAVIFSLCLEANGFIKYDNRIVYDKNGLPANLDTIKTAKMLNLNLKNNFRCAICGLLYDNCSKNNLHKFKQATYILRTGIHGSHADINYIRSDKNKYGNLIKVLVGSRVTGEGIDLKWIRQIHIIDPWHNNTRIYQIIGRGIRNCSHIELNENERNVMIFKYCSTGPDFNILHNYKIVSLKYLSNNNLITNYDETLQNLTLFDEKLNKLIPDQYNYGITYRQYFTETADEVIYKRIKIKDLQIKKIERILKTSAVDCEFNKNVNNYWGIDKDYTRECDYDLCEYKCYGYKNPIIYVDIEIDQSKHIIKSKYFFNTEIINYNNTDINIRNKLIKIINYYTDININDNNTHLDIVNKIKFYILNKGARYDLKKKIYKFEEPIVEKDISTYNIHFAQPQIDKALLYIRKLFQHNLILTEKNIIDLVVEQDSLIDVEFIRSALDQMVGNLPNIEPKEMKDKYNRLGYILYVNGYYIFHPSEIKNQKIPIYYKNTPLKKKKDYIGISDLIENTTYDNRNNLTNARDNIVDDMFKTFRNILHIKKNKKSHGRHIKKLIKIATVRYKLDTEYTIEEQELFYKYIIKELINIDNNPNIDKNNLNENILELKELSNVLTDYYTHLFLVYFDKEQLYTFFNNKYVSKLDNKKGIWIDKLILDDNDSVIKHYNSEPQTRVNDKNEGFYGFISTSYTKNPRKKFIISDESLNFSKTQEALTRLLTYIKNYEDLNTLKFKFINKSKENIKNTFGGNLSKKSFKSGVNCLQSIAEAKELLNTLINLFTENELYYENNYIDPEILLDKIYHYSECDKISILLKILDIIKYKNVRWFLSSFETEYFRPLLNS